MTGRGYAPISAYDRFEITIPETVSDGVNTFTVVEIGFKSFRGASKAIIKSIPNTIRVISDYAFDMVGLESFPNLPNLESVGYLSFSTNSFGIVTIPDNLKYISDAALAYNDIIAINLPSNNKYFSLDEQNAFYDYHKTRVLYVPKQSTYKIPLTVQYVPDHIFANQIFEEIVIPPACSSVGYGSFRNCNNLKKIIITGNIYSWKDDSLSSLSSLELIEYFGTITLKDQTITSEKIQIFACYQYKSDYSFGLKVSKAYECPKINIVHTPLCKQFNYFNHIHFIAIILL